MRFAFGIGLQALSDWASFREGFIGLPFDFRKPDDTPLSGRLQIIDWPDVLPQRPTSGEFGLLNLPLTLGKLRLIVSSCDQLKSSNCDFWRREFRRLGFAWGTCSTDSDWAWVGSGGVNELGISWMG